MLWLAGLMGILAVGAVGVVDMGNADEEDGDVMARAQVGGLPVAPEDDPSQPENLPETSAEPEVEAPAFQGTDGNDIRFGSDDADTMAGGAGDDSLHGENGNDMLNGDDGDDTLFGHNDDDTLNGGAGDDSLQGSDGNDVVNGDEGDDAVHGGLGDDTLSGGAGADTLFGGWGNDLVNGVVDDPDTDGITDTDDADFLNGGGGDDVIIAGNDDVVTPGEGADTIITGSWITDTHAIDIIDFNAEDDSILLIYEDEDEVPDVTLAPDLDDANITQVLMDGVAVANVMNGAGITIEDISLMPLSLAQSTGMAPL